ncbi:NAD(P)-binding protein [Wallemia mellicola]|nr:NAD(P)-binding protein [Wallemia mellicola]
MSTPRVWLITGTSSGLGRALVETILAKGETVVATLRKPEVLKDLSDKYDQSKLLVLKLDVTNSQDIDDVFSKIKEVYNRLDVIVNNAGRGIVGEFEATTKEDGKSLFDINFWGPVEITKKAIEFFRSVNKPSGGRILNIASMAGYNAGPGMAIYSATKHAIVGVSESIARELDPTWNIKITTIGPGGFRTKALDNVTSLPPHPEYTEPSLITNLIRQYLPVVPLPGDATKGAEAIYTISNVENPPANLILGADAREQVQERINNLTKGLEAYEDLSASTAYTE